MGKRVLMEEQNNNQRYTEENQNQPMGFQSSRAWRKHCLFLIVFLLIILISINLALTLWILKALEVSQNGMGRIKIVDKGLELDGSAVIMDKLKTSHIRARTGQPIIFESAKNLSFNIREANGEIQNQMFIGHDRFEVTAKKFQVNDIQGNTLLRTSKSLIEFSAGALRVEGDGGVIFSDSIQTPILKSEAGKDLKFDCPTRSLDIKASQEIFIQSIAGSFESASLNDLILSSETGSIRLDADKIFLTNLAPISNEKPSSEHFTSANKVYQLCICESGKIFLSYAALCSGDSAICHTKSIN